MKSEKGITLNSLIIYIILITLVLGLLVSISNYFYSNLDYVNDTGKTMFQFNKFNMYFIEDVKNNTDLYSIEDEKIVFEDGTVYTFANGNIYRNKSKICDEIEILKFSTVNNDTNKNIVRVDMAIKGSTVFVSSNEYVLKYW